MSSENKLKVESDFFNHGIQQNSEGNFKREKGKIEGESTFLVEQNTDRGTRLCIGESSRVEEWKDPCVYGTTEIERQGSGKTKTKVGKHAKGNGRRNKKTEGAERSGRNSRNTTTCEIDTEEKRKRDGNVVSQVTKRRRRDIEKAPLYTNDPESSLCEGESMAVRGCSSSGTCSDGLDGLATEREKEVHESSGEQIRELFAMEKPRESISRGKKNKCDAINLHIESGFVGREPDSKKRQKCMPDSTEGQERINLLEPVASDNGQKKQSRKETKKQRSKLSQASTDDQLGSVDEKRQGSTRSNVGMEESWRSVSTGLCEPRDDGRRRKRRRTTHANRGSSCVMEITGEENNVEKNDLQHGTSCGYAYPERIGNSKTSGFETCDDNGREGSRDDFCTHQKNQESGGSDGAGSICASMRSSEISKGCQKDSHNGGTEGMPRNDVANNTTTTGTDKPPRTGRKRGPRGKKGRELRRARLFNADFCKPVGLLSQVMDAQGRPYGISITPEEARACFRRSWVEAPKQICSCKYGRDGPNAAPIGFRSCKMHGYEGTRESTFDPYTRARRAALKKSVVGEGVFIDPFPWNVDQNNMVERGHGKRIHLSNLVKPISKEYITTAEQTTSILYKTIGQGNIISLPLLDDGSECPRGAVPPRVVNMAASFTLGAKKVERYVLTEGGVGAFYNPLRFKAVTFAIVLKDIEHAPTITGLFFQSGKVVLAGAQSEKHALYAATVIAGILGRRLNIPDVSVHNFFTCNVVAVTDMGFSVDIQALANTMGSRAHYQIEQYPFIRFHRFDHNNVKRRNKPDNAVAIICETGMVVTVGCLSVKITKQLIREVIEYSIKHQIQSRDDEPRFRLLRRKQIFSSAMDINRSLNLRNKMENVGILDFGGMKTEYMKKIDFVRPTDEQMKDVFAIASGLLLE